MSTSERRTLWALTRGERLRYGGAIAAMAVGIVTIFGAPLVSRWAVDALLAAEGPVAPAWLARIGEALGIGSPLAQVLVGAGAGILLLTAIGSAFHYLRGRWAAQASEAITRDLRDRLFLHLARLPCAHLDRADTGDLVQRCTSDVETVRTFLSGQVVEVGRVAFLLLAVLPILVWIDPAMAAVAVALFPAILGFAVLFFRRIKDVFRRTDEAEGALTTVLQENLTGIRVVRAFARQEFETAKFAARNAAFRDETQRLIRLLGAFWTSSDFLCFVQLGLVLFAGAQWTLAGRLSVGDLQAFLMYEAMVVWPLRHLGRVLAELGKAVVSLGRLREILGVPEEGEGDRPAAAAPVFLSGGIDVERLSFAYRPGEPVLDDVTFHLRPGETIALLGPPGSGKSALIHVLLRLYDYERGSVRLDGLELASLPRDYVRSQIGAVLQEPFLFSRTLRANVAFGRAGARDDEIVRAASAAAVHDTIAGFERGYDTLVGERGVTLSGGQRQRVAIARALLKDPPLLILDDALSAVDTRTETDILRAIDARRGSRTTILITHRLSAAVGADRILVLERGRIVQEGPHAALAAAPGPYRRLWKIQGALEEDLVASLAAGGAAGGAP
ncbi:MAG: ABC transporter ATP-binding protein [Planctomycetota bacterium]